MASNLHFVDASRTTLRTRFTALLICLVVVGNLLGRLWGQDADSRSTLESEGKYGFISIFNGRDLTGWQGATDGYEVRGGAIVCKEGKGGIVLFTEEQYDDFVVRFEFKLPPGGNNGLAIRYPGTGHVAYDAMCELQILDDDAEQYAKLDPRQYHGSVYGVAAAHRGYLRPTGQWNFQEVTVQGSTIRVELNGTVIVDTDVSQITEFKDNLAHPGLGLKRGHFGFAGHQDPVAFRNISIKRLTPATPTTETSDTVEEKLQRLKLQGLLHDAASSMVFHSSFDSVSQANLSKGQGVLLQAESSERKELQPLMTAGVISIGKNQGRYGDALRFLKKTKEVLFYEGIEFGYRQLDWSGSVSLWLKLDPNQDLEPGFCDPIQITERGWNDAAFFVDFDKVLPRDFRLGVFPNLETWNPKNTDIEQIPVESRPMVTVKRPPFSANAWTHICFTWAGVNASDQRPAVASLYLNGKLQGSLERPLQFTWDPEKAGIMLGLNYIGLMDDLIIFRKALSAEQVELLYKHPVGGLN